MRFPLNPGVRVARPQKRDSVRVLLNALSRFGTIIALIALVVTFSVAGGSLFFASSNVIEIFSSVAITGVIACGLTIALATGVYDLSVGFVASFAGVLVTGLMSSQHLSVVKAIIITLFASAAIGLVNGLIVTKARVTSFVATLGTGTIVVGLNYAYSSGVSVVGGVPDSFTNINLRRIASIPLPVYIMVAVAIVLWILLNRTVLGQNVQAVGGNPGAAHLAGIRVDRTRILALIISATCAGAGGILLAAKLGSGQTTGADSYLLTAFAAAFLGSVALREGEFHIVGTLVGILIVGVGFNGLAITNAPPFYSNVFNGGVLIGAVALSTVARGLASR